MKQLRDNLWIGNIDSPQNPEILKQNGITAILNVAFNVTNPQYNPADFRMVQINLDDDSDNPFYLLRLTIDTLKIMWQEKEKVLVHCQLGKSRSTWVICQTIAELEKREIDDVLKEIQEKYPEAIKGPLFI